MKKASIVLFALILIQVFTVPIYAEEIPEWARREEERVYAYAADTEESETKLYENIPVEYFHVGNISPLVQTDLDYTDWQYNEWEDNRYLYLPATANRSKLMITYKADADVYLDDMKITSGSLVSLIKNEYNITVGGVDCGKLIVMQSNLGCIYLSTSTGGLDALDKNGNLVETGNAIMLDTRGRVQYDGPLEKITSHGNSSWSYSKKKPYNFKLPQKADLYGMGKAKKWMLISNYLDHSMLRNYFTMELSRKAGMEYAIDSTFVDLYADGSYRGMYQLCERIQIQKTRLNIRDLEEATEKLNEKALDEYPRIVVGANSVNDCKVNSYKCYDIPNDPADITGGYLLQFQQWNRYGYKAESGFVTKRGQAVQIDGPEIASQKQVSYIAGFMQELEDAIYSDTGYNSLGKHYSDYMDVDSLATAYIIQEFSMNVDAGASSFYMWKDSDLTGDGKLHFGPAWDFDLAYGTFARSVTNSEGDWGWSLSTDNLFAAYFPINGYSKDNTPESGLPTEGVNWLGKMYKKLEYKNRVARVWYDKFAPVLNSYISSSNSGLTNFAKTIQPSAEMSNKRWHTYGGRQYCVFGDRSGKDFLESVDMVRQYAADRRKYLDEIWEQYRYVYGDVDYDGFVTNSDTALILKYVHDGSLYLPIQNKTNEWKKYADVDEDGKLTSLDTIYTIKKAMDSSFTMPCEQ